MTESPASPIGELILYETEDGRTRVECRFADETLWLSQALIAELFGVSVPTVNEHLKSAYEAYELSPEATIRKFRIVRQEGGRQVTRNIDHYNLEAILAVGYRVRSSRGTQFRRWATERLREYLVKGFTMDDVRLKNPPIAGSGIPDYFDELLERIRDIRASEARMYLRVREILALAADYRANDADTVKFFKVMQNKLHFAATGMTAAELIKARANHSLPYMGLTTFKSGEVRKADVGIAKNYLSEGEISELNRIVSMWLDYADDQARRRQQIHMKDWEEKLDGFLAFNERDVLKNAGQVSHDHAVRHAEDEYEHYAAERRALLEAEGERDAEKALEDAARTVMHMKKKPSARQK
ncbi:MAG: virulence RhuM family protein [Alphaproteobacteria bacterium]|nr:virulence RhuM family protein [Alphaproteobacteria bacterium]